MTHSAMAQDLEHFLRRKAKEKGIGLSGMRETQPSTCVFRILVIDNECQRHPEETAFIISMVIVPILV